MNKKSQLNNQATHACTRNYSYSNLNYLNNIVSCKRSQSIIEFVVIFGAVLFFFVAFLLVIQENTREKNLEKETILARDIALSVKDEINLASESTDGYYREFRVPNKLLGKDYEISITEGWVYLKAKKIATSYKVLNVTGDIQKGINVIVKQNGSVYLN